MSVECNGMSSTFISDEDIEKLLKHKNNGINKVRIIPEVKIKVLGSGNHGNQSTDSKKSGEQLRGVEEKADVGVLATLIGNKGAGLLLGVGPTQVSQYKNGKNGSNVTDIELKTELDSRLGKLEEKAIDKVELFLEMISEEKASALNANEAATSAEKMVNIVDKIRRRNEDRVGDINRPQIHIYGPSQIKIDEYIVKEV